MTWEADAIHDAESHFLEVFDKATGRVDAFEKLPADTREAIMRGVHAVARLWVGPAL